MAKTAALLLGGVVLGVFVSLAVIRLGPSGNMRQEMGLVINQYGIR